MDNFLHGDLIHPRIVRICERYDDFILLEFSFPFINLYVLRADDFIAV